MRLAISNIAWAPSDETQAADLLAATGITGVEIAPTAKWPRPLEASAAEVAAYRAFWESRGVRIVALQALLFGRTDLTIFENVEKRRVTFEYLSGMIRLAADLGARVLVFGSPKNRQVGALARAEANRLAQSFFHDLGEVAVAHDTVFCIEPNPPEYGCDFLTTSTEALDLIRSVNSPGLGLHLDAGGMTLSREPLAAVDVSLPWLRHFHISEPHLAAIGGGGSDHSGYGETLARIGYQGWTSIEMRRLEAGGLQSVKDALTCARDRYAPLGAADRDA